MRKLYTSAWKWYIIRYKQEELKSTGVFTPITEELITDLMKQIDNDAIYELGVPNNVQMEIIASVFNEWLKE